MPFPWSARVSPRRNAAPAAERSGSSATALRTTAARRSKGDAAQISWTIYKVAAKLQPLGIVEATNADEAIEKGAVEYRIPASKLIAIRRP